MMTKDRDVLTFRCSSLAFFHKPYAFPIKQENVLKQKIENPRMEQWCCKELRVVQQRVTGDCHKSPHYGICVKLGILLPTSPPKLTYTPYDVPMSYPIWCQIFLSWALLGI